MLFFSRQYRRFFFHSNLVKPTPRMDKSRPTNIISEEQYSSYYEKKLDKVSVQVRGIINEMASPFYDYKKCKSMIEGYLDTHKKLVQAPGLLTLLTALQKIDNKSLKEDSTNLIVAYILRSPNTDQFICDEKNLLLVLNAIIKVYRSKFYKLQKTIVKYRYAQLLKLNIDCINVDNAQTSHFKDIIKHLILLRDDTLVTESTRFISLALLIEEKANKYIENAILTALPTIQITKHSNFLKNLSQFYLIFPPYHTKSVQTLYLGCIRCFFILKNVYEGPFISLIYAYFPSIGQNAEGIYYRDLILKEIQHAKTIQRMQKNPEIKFYHSNDQEFTENIDNQDLKKENNSWQYSLFLYNIIAFQFYKTINSVQFRYHENFNYLFKEDLTRPQLPSLFWKLYKKHPQSYNTSSFIFQQVLSKIYPEQYIQTNSVPKVVVPTAASENEIRLRATMALEKLKIKAESEVFLCGRYVDFVLQQDIILQIDGDYHFNFHEMDYNMMTQFRNLHLLLSGYRVVLINIFEYNQNRFVDQLSQILQKKISFLKESGAVLVI